MIATTSVADGSYLASIRQTCRGRCGRVFYSAERRDYCSELCSDPVASELARRPTRGWTWSAA